MKIIIKKLVISALFVAPLLLYTNVYAVDINKLREQAVSLARQGEIEQSYQELVLLHAKYPHDLPILYDLIEISSRAGHLKQSFNYGQKISNPSSTPSYVLEHMAKVARNMKEFALSYLYYQILYKHKPKADYLLGSVLATSLSRQFDYAQKMLSRMQKTFPNTLEYYMAKGFFETQKNTYSQASQTFLTGLKYYSNNAELLRGLLNCYRKLGAFSRAENLIKAHPKVFSQKTEDLVAGDLLANRIRWGDNTHLSYNSENQFRHETIRQLEEQSQVAGSSNNRTNFDLLLAYVDANQSIQAIELYEQLLGREIKVPSYAMASIAEAYLNIKEPEKTIAIYQQIYPNKIPYEAQQNLFYAYTELRQFEHAEKLLKKMRKENSILLGKDTLRSPESNPKRIDIEIYEITLEAEKGNLAGAYQQATELSDEAPSNASIRETKASTAAYRGWHEAADTDYEIATNLDPNRLSTMISMTNNDMNQGNYAEARSKLRLLLKLRPNNQRILQTKDEWQRRSGWQFNSEIGYADNKDSVFGRDEVKLQTTIQAPRINDKWRPFASHEITRAKFAETNHQFRRTVAGVNYERGGSRATFALGNASNNKLAADIGLIRHFGDYWQFGLAYQHNSTPPLRGSRDGVDGNKISTSLRYRADEKFQVEASGNYDKLSDDNRRIGLAVTGEQQLYRNPSYELKGRLRADYNHNQKIDSASYFNPSHSSGLTLALDNHWLTYARYDFKFSQNLSLEFGATNQAGFGSDGLGQIRYGHDWQFSKDIGIYYYANWKTQVYDGNRENSSSFMFGFNWALH